MEEVRLLLWGDMPFLTIIVLGPVSEMTRSLNNEVLHICAQTLFAPVSSFDAVRAVGRLILTAD